MKKTSNIEIDENVYSKYATLFGEKTINGKKIIVEDVIYDIYRDVNSLINRALNERRELINSGESVIKRYNFKLDEIFTDTVTGNKLAFCDIINGMIDNLNNKKTDLSWRLNENFNLPDYINPLKNPGLEITGPWDPLDMAIKQINADVSSTMGPDDEDAAPADYAVYNSDTDGIPLMNSRVNENGLLSNRLTEYKKGEKPYRIEKKINEVPPSFHRVPGIHLLTDYIKIDNNKVPSVITDYVIHALNDFNSLRENNKILLYYQPKIQTPLEAEVIAKIVYNLEKILGADKPGSLIKIKLLYEEGSAGRYLPAIMWILRYWLIGSNVGRWDYTASIIEMYKNEKVLPDPQSSKMGMASEHMMAYQRYNALLNLMAGIRDNELINGGPIGGMAAVMLYNNNDPYNRYLGNNSTLRSMKIDKLRERLIGLIFITDRDYEDITLNDILNSRAGGKLYDTYRQSWVASPDKNYVGAGNMPLRAGVDKLQDMVNKNINYVNNIPTVESGLTTGEKNLFYSIGLLNKDYMITPWIINKNDIDSPEKILKIFNGLWNKLYNINDGDITIENIQHAFYMAANYGFQVLNGNLAAAIDDYSASNNYMVRFMNDLAVYRIYVSWLWTLLHMKSRITENGSLKAPELTVNGVIPAKKVFEIKSGTLFDNNLFDKIFNLHNEWTGMFFDDYDKISSVRVMFSSLLYKNNINNSGEILNKIVQKLSVKYNDVKALEEIIKLYNLKEDANTVSYNLIKIKSILKDIYDMPVNKRSASYNRGAVLISSMLSVDSDYILNELKKYAPRFDRNKAPVIMDVLKRQLLSPLYIQHSARILFAIAGRNDMERNNILNTVFYMDSDLKPLYRDSSNKQSRDKIVMSVKNKEIDKNILNIHDYIYDIR